MVLASKDLRFRVPLLLIALSLVPLVAGIIRLHGLASGGEITDDNSRFFLTPTPVAIHIVSSTLFSLLGAFQFPQSFRTRWTSWHRKAGWLVASCGFVAAITGLWMTLFYVIPAMHQGPILYVVRLAVSCGMALSIILAVNFAIKRNFRLHRAWMIRSYALGLGAGTQVVIILPFTLIFGEVTGEARDVLMTAAWVINILIAEKIIKN